MERITKAIKFPNKKILVANANKAYINTIKYSKQNIRRTINLPSAFNNFK